MLDATTCNINAMFMPVLCADGSDASFLLPAGAEQQVLIIPGYLTSAQHLQLLDQQRRQQEQQQAAQQQIVLPPCPYFRVSFASVDSSAMLEGFARLKAAIKSRKP
jgi:DNA-binding transcriptional MocR family regulator